MCPWTSNKPTNVYSSLLQAMFYDSKFLSSYVVVTINRSWSLRRMFSLHTCQIGINSCLQEEEQIDYRDWMR